MKYQEEQINHLQLELAKMKARHKFKHSCLMSITRYLSKDHDTTNLRYQQAKVQMITHLIQFEQCMKSLGATVEIPLAES